MKGFRDNNRVKWLNHKNSAMILHICYVSPGADCSCISNGNIYEVESSDSCTSFTQSTPDHHTVRTFSCPGNLRFNIRNCVCDHASAVVCPDHCTTHTDSRVTTQRNSNSKLMAAKFSVIDIVSKYIHISVFRIGN